MNNFLFQIVSLLLIVWTLQMAYKGFRIKHTASFRQDADWSFAIWVVVFIVWYTMAHYREWPLPWPL